MEDIAAPVALQATARQHHRRRVEPPRGPEAAGAGREFLEAFEAYRRAISRQMPAQVARKGLTEPLAGHLKGPADFVSAPSRLGTIAHMLDTTARSYSCMRSTIPRFLERPETPPNLALQALRMKIRNDEEAAARARGGGVLETHKTLAHAVGASPVRYSTMRSPVKRMEQHKSEAVRIRARAHSDALAAAAQSSLRAPVARRRSRQGGDALGPTVGSGAWVQPQASPGAGHSSAIATRGAASAGRWRGQPEAGGQQGGEGARVFVPEVAFGEGAVRPALAQAPGSLMGQAREAAGGGGGGGPVALREVPPDSAHRERLRPEHRRSAPGRHRPIAASEDGSPTGGRGRGGRGGASPTGGRGRGGSHHRSGTAGSRDPRADSKDQRPRRQGSSADHSARATAAVKVSEEESTVAREWRLRRGRGTRGEMTSEEKQRLIDRALGLETHGDVSPEIGRYGRVKSTRIEVR